MMEAVPGSGGDATKRKRGPFAIILTLGGLATAVAAIVGLVFLLKPAWKPGYSPPPKSGEVGLVTVARGNPATMHVRLQIKGFHREKCKLHYSVLYKDPMGGVPVEGFKELPGAEVTPKSDDDSRTVAFKISHPGVKGAYRTFVQLRDPDGGVLDQDYGPDLWVY